MRQPKIVFRLACGIAIEAVIALTSAHGQLLAYGGVAGPATQPTKCVLQPKTSALPTGQIEHLGIHATGKSQAFYVPPHTGTLSIIQQAVGPVTQTVQYQGASVPNYVTPTQLTAPDGTVLYVDGGPQPADLSAAHVAPPYSTAITGVLTIPNSTQGLVDANAAAGSTGGYPAGIWHATVNDLAYECLTISGCTGGTAANHYQLTVLKKPAGSAGRLDVAIYFASQLSASQYTFNPGFLRFFSSLVTIYASAGITINTVTTYDLQPWAKALYATGVDAADTSPCSDFSQLFTLSNPGVELPLFFVDAIEDSGSSDGEILGIDGSIAGPASVGGTVDSGAVVNASDLLLGSCSGPPNLEQCGADLTAYVAAHEGGHYLGLFHTTEAYGQANDPLQDTPTCSCSSACLPDSQAQLCATGGITLSGAVCTQTVGSPCGGGDNLMFWAVSPASLGTLTAEQGQVMSSNPALH